VTLIAGKSLVRTLACVVLVAFVGCGYFLPVNMHLHTLPNGRVIVHSHPAGDEGKGGRSEHSHSDLEFTFLAHVGKIPGKVCTPATLAVTATYVTCYKAQTPEHILTSKAYFSSTGQRDPPNTPSF